jgi:hypothetical protein
MMERWSSRRPSSSQVTTAEAEAEAVKKSSSLSRWIKVISGLLFIAFIAYVIGNVASLLLLLLV